MDGESLELRNLYLASNDNISFLSCGIALYVGGVVKDPQGLFYSSPEELAKLGVKTKMLHDVLEIDVDNKSLKVRNLETKEEFDDSFDKLILTTAFGYPL